MSNEVLQTILSCPTLPTLPAVALKVLELTRDPKVGLGELGKVVQADPALSAKVLKTVNSSLYGLTTQCSKIDRALSYLGLNAVKSLVLGFSLVDCTRGVSKGRGLDMQAHWRRATFAAAGARTMAQITKACDPDEAFTAAVFSDIGVLAAFLALGDRYSDILEKAANHDALAGIEFGELKVSHATIGAELAAKWRLPTQYVEAIRHHHTPELSNHTDRALTRIVALGGTLAEALSSQQPKPYLSAVVRGMGEWFGKRPENLEEILSKVSEGAQDLARVFEKDIGTAPNIQLIMAEASEQALEAQMATQRESVQLRVQNEELSIASFTDALTGAKNRKCFDLRLGELFAAAATAKSAFAVVFSDADKFKSVNDRFGHPAGDAVLKILAQRLKAAVGANGEVFRYGGEEFAILLAGHGLEAAALVAERLRLAIEAPHFDLSGVAGAPATLAVTLSLGVAATDAGIFSDGMAVVKAADEAVYKSKQNGRNRVTRHGTIAAVSVGSIGAVGAGRQRVLVVEDDALASKLIQLALAKCPSVELLVVRSLSDARGKLSPAWAGAIVDMELRDGLGTDLISHARAGGFEGPILAMSAEPNHSAEALRAGATEFVDKVSFCRDLARWTGAIEQWGMRRAAA